MRRLAFGLAVAFAAACGGAASRGETTTQPVTPAPSATVTITPAGTVFATAISGSIQPIPPGTTFTPAPPTPTPSPTPSPAPGGLTQAQLKYRLVDRFGSLLFCDPDFYPIARVDEQSQADQRFPEIQKDGPTFSAILAHLGIAPAATYTSEQRLAVYRDWKMLNALALEPVSAGFHFNAIFAGQSGATPQPRGGSRVDGTIDQRGTIAVASQTPSGQPPCPICLARGTRISTPAGDVAVESLRAGDLVWTPGANGTRVAAALVAIGSTPVPASHQVVRLVLDDGRLVYVSPGHPTADGRRVGDLAAGDGYDGATVASAERVRYDGGATFDILPAGVTGAYWANGVLLGSTLR
jgi:hypothetical protein